jgi:hypothetical protein
MKSLPFDKAGRFYRGNLHTHSDHSDGTLSPEATVATNRTRGYDFLALTDHFQKQYGFPITDTRASRTPRFATLLGAELTGPRTAGGPDIDLVAIGLPLDFEPPVAGETAPELAARAAAAGAFVGLAHPLASQVSLDEALAVEAADAVEIYNGVVSRKKESWSLSDALSARGRRHSAFAADDNHFLARKPSSPLAWVHVRANRLEPEALLAALKAGHFYSSQGPELHDVAIAGNTMHITCSPAAVVLLTGPPPHGRSRRGEGITTCAFALDRFWGDFCRVTLVDAAGRRAWSNPIWLDR